MTNGMRVAFFGSSLVSAYWNGAATYYRGIIRALHRRGHRVTFLEPDAYDRQAHRDIPDPDWAEVVVYPPSEAGAAAALERARGADLIVKASGVGVLDAWLEREVPALRSADGLVVFWDVDAPATLDRMHADPDDPFHLALPRYDLVLTYGGGEPVVRAYRAAGARGCEPIYNALDPTTHHPAPPDPRFAADLGFLGNRLPDREARVEAFFLEAARRAPGRSFVLGGSGWDDKPLPANVRRIGHVYTADHNAFNRTPRAVLNISRDSMARYGFSPATRVFEAAGAAACLMTDAWEGIERFLEPEREVLVVHDGAEVAARLEALASAEARAIGERARRRMLAEHTYEHRAARLEEVLGVDGGRGVGGRAPGRAARPRPTDAAVEPLRIVILGLSLTSSWGNGHATTYRALLSELAARGHAIRFLERDVPWYAAHRDQPTSPDAELALYRSVEELDAWTDAIATADLVIVGSYVPDGVQVGDRVLATARGVTAFYDIDTPVTLARLARGDLDYLEARQIPRYRAYLSFTGGPTLRRLEADLGSPCARALYCSVDPSRYRPLEVEPRWDLAYMGTYSDDRQPALDRLLVATAEAEPARRFAVAGALYPDDVRWPANVERVEHLPPDEHPAFYSAARWSLNLTRRDMIEAGWSPSVRLFEAAAAGSPLISDWWPGLEDFFRPGREILTAGDTAEVRRVLAEVGEDERRAIAARAREAVLARHTATHRAVELEAIVAEVREAGARRGRVARRAVPVAERT